MKQNFEKRPENQSIKRLTIEELSQITGGIRIDPSTSDGGIIIL